MDPGDGIGAGFEASANVELQHHGGFRLPGENLNRPGAVDDSELGLVVVIADLEASGLELFCSGVQEIGDGGPAIWLGLGIGIGHDDVLASENQVQVAGALDVLRIEIGLFVVRRETARMPRSSSKCRICLVWLSERSK